MSSEKRILCVGLCILDFVHVCEKPLEETVKVHITRGHWQRGGSASNTSTCISVLGGNVEFLGVLSSSRGFQMLRNDLIEKNINIENCPRHDIDPGFSSIFLDQSTKTRTVITSLNQNSYVKLEEFKKIDLDNYSLIHFEGKFSKETCKMMQHVHEYNQDHEDNKIILSVGFDFVGNDTRFVGEEIYHLTDVTDLIILSKAFSSSHGWTNMKEAAFNLRESITNKNILILCFWNDAGTGMLYNNIFEVIEPYRIDNTIDPLGYTDAFVAGTLYSISLGNDYKDAADYGNKVAALKVQQFGFDHLNDVTLKL